MKKSHLLFDLFVFAIAPFSFGIGFFMMKEKVMTYVGPITGEVIEPLILLRVGAFFAVVGAINFISLAARQEIFVKIFLIVGLGCIAFGNFGPWTKEFPFVQTGTLSIILGAFNSLSFLIEGPRKRTKIVTTEEEV